jgi:predicted secreted protein
MDIPAELRLKTRETYVLRLKNLASAGYTWNYSMEGNENAVTISKEVQDNSPNVAAAGTFSGDQEFVIQAQEPGKITLHFVLHRSWEKDKPPAQAFTLEVHVDP